MKSIRTKIILAVLTAVLTTAVLLVVLSTVSMNILNENDSSVLLRYIGQENATNINRLLDSVQHSVNSISYYAKDQAEGRFDELKNDKAAREEYISAVEAMAITEAENDGNVKVVYYRIAQELGEPEGFLYQYYEGTGKLEKRMLTPIDVYDKDDYAHVGWYYAPIEAGEPVWLGPYDNYNLKMRVVSYEVPIYVDGEFLGVIGMDLDITTLNKELSNIRAYQSGSAILYDQNKNMVYQKNHIRGFAREKFSGDDENILSSAEKSALIGEAVDCRDSGSKLYGITLNNGMLLCITAPLDEIDSTQKQVLTYSIIASLVILALVAILTALLINNYLKPLRELTDAAKQLSDGNMDISLHYNSRDEIGTLSETFVTMANSLKKDFDHYHGLAYTDNLTGLNNKASFQRIRDLIENEIRTDRASFRIIVMDVNNLKIINDTIGHEMGDVLLRHVADCMRKAFVGLPLFRIGGDEFCSVINKTIDADELIRHLQEITADSSEKDFELFKIHYQIAAGASAYQKGDTFQDVFNRADQAMYENKRMLKKADS